MKKIKMLRLTRCLTEKNMQRVKMFKRLRLTKSMSKPQIEKNWKAGQVWRAWNLEEMEVCLEGFEGEVSLV